MTRRIGFFGLLGSGNLGNDGSLDAVVGYLRERHPEARLDFLCMGPERVRQRYGTPATPLHWYDAQPGTAAGVLAAPRKLLGKLLDPFRTLAWVRRQDVVIVPGMGVLEATLPLRPWGFPYALFFLAVAARLTGAKVALISVGASTIRDPATRWLVTSAARLATYRSYRDELSRQAMREMGVDVSRDPVYPDLAFALPVPPATPETGAVGVGVMAYYGGNDDRARAERLHRAYVETMRRFVRTLADGGRSVRLFTGDEVDERVVAEILATPGLDTSRVTAERPADLAALLTRMNEVDTVVATRYHNVLSALKLGKPTLSLGYAAKNDVLMAGMGLGEFCQPARSVDFDRLLEQFTKLESRREELTATLARRNREQTERLAEQFALLSKTLLEAP
ncbi:polysaccharide pyruvyl transferase family protein [Prauserella muralis]|uniref:Uncharacterized protein n=1 Tax=Prauserella muralis TaxID=588067 RepID=A0A2V4B9X2_9PSEU|nr:polysaccharide pyruvyl transferase family protein [Prauserella muralis]PXY32078.1 hypothetical protein BAY60_07170 [Prauserella muralis]TWE13468.1 polysaccharide pyruvyl transferase WcaK-like protein [Prauserella muralis]